MRQAHPAEIASHAAADEIHGAAPPHGNPHELFTNSLRGAGLDLERLKDYPRAFEIE
jgi:hypothetical protein